MTPDFPSANAAKQKRLLSCMAHASNGGFISSKSRRASLIILACDLVERRPFRGSLICPLCVAVDGGRCLSSCSVNPGKEDNPLVFFNALRIVVVGGENSDWWWYCANSALGTGIMGVECVGSGFFFNTLVNYWRGYVIMIHL